MKSSGLGSGSEVLVDLFVDLLTDLTKRLTYKKEGFSARTTSEIPREFYKECLLELKNRDINSWNKICTMFPDARGFV